VTGPTSALEAFFLRYIEHAGGIWDEIEPQLYDLLLPDSLENVLGSRVTFDPEALQDYPTVQLMAFGNPALDAIFEQAQARHHVAQVYLGGLNLTPHNLAAIVQRGLQVPAGSTLTLLSQRPLHYHAALWWFQATFISDEKVQESYSIGTDLHFGRITRHLEELLREYDASGNLNDSPAIAYPDASSLPLSQGYSAACEEVTRAITVAAHERLNELQRLLTHEVERITRYFDDSRKELDERLLRAKEAKDGGELSTKLSAQRAAYDREQSAQINELQRKMALSVQVRLMNVLCVSYPKIRIEACLSVAKAPPAQLALVYDPANKRLDPLPCPTCGRPTLSLQIGKSGQVFCDECGGGGSTTVRR
jgi:hypothetical protein